MPAQMPGLRQSHTPTVPQSRPAELRYKCEVCGKFRSTRYHYENPIPPGRLPARTICRKCRETATDTEDGSSDGPPSNRPPRSHGRRTPRSRSRQTPGVSLQSRRRARSVERLQAFSQRHDRSVDPSSSESSLSSSLEECYRSRRRPRSSSRHTELVRHTQRMRLSPVGQLILRDFDEDNSRPRRRHQDVGAYGGIDRRRQHTRTGTSIGERDRHEQAYRRGDGRCDDFLTEEHRHIHRSRYQDNARPYSPQHGRSRSQAPHRPGLDGEIDDHKRESGEILSLSETHPHQRHHGSRGCGGSSTATSSLSSSELPDTDGPRRQTRSGRDGRFRSRSRRLGHDAELAGMMRPGDELTLIERHPPYPPDDYEWYDNEGMRVRVREY